MARGCIYIARNDQINPPNLYKVGKTEFAEPKRRMKDLSNETTNWDGKYEAKAWVFVEDVDKCEKIIHHELKDYRVNKNREFFLREFNDILDSVRISLNDFIIPGHGYLEEFDIHHVSKKTFKSILKNKTSSILKLFDFVNKDLMCTNLDCWEDHYAFRCSLSVIILNSLNKEISTSLLNNPDDLKNILYKEIYIKELCKQLAEINEDHLYLFNNNINNEQDQHPHILNKKSLKPIILNNIFNILDRARRLNKKLKIIIYRILKYSDFYDAYYLDYKKNLINSRNFRLQTKEATKEAEEAEKQRKIEKELKKEENKIKVKKQKIDQNKRNLDRKKYLENLRKLPLDLRLKDIVEKQTYGLNGIPEQLFETENEKKFMLSFVKLEINEQKKFKKLIKKNKKKFFRKLNKLLNNN